MLVIPVLERLRQEDQEFEASLGHIYIHTCIYRGREEKERQREGVPWQNPISKKKGKKEINT
jgi:hypothetical protein